MTRRGHQKSAASLIVLWKVGRKGEECEFFVVVDSDEAGEVNKCVLWRNRHVPECTEP